MTGVGNWELDFTELEMELTSSSSLIPRAIGCVSYGVKVLVKGAFLGRLGGRVSRLGCYSNQSSMQNGWRCQKELSLRVSAQASNSVRLSFIRFLIIIFCKCGDFSFTVKMELLPFSG